ncbi:hypothetical protein [Chryseobacterium oryctis]|uniref:Secreted protein n=1 Tax=Chryseobacterium oryctis TaxID=2952618 RepID=A0ABT3HLJ9_9FLAO|nr:hypothetical protein [Chryseobacterium oryctis]MCW3160657.1 hypothetical protein [Chryseobacterium oryctis]
MASKFTLFILLILGISAFSQTKKKFTNIPSVLNGIIPNDRIDFWILVHNEYGKDKEVRTSGTKKDYVSQSSGFNLFPDEDSFYYIVYSSAGKINYVTDFDALKSFIGKIDNVEEASIAATIDGYLIDEEFKDVAANYYEDTSNYYLDLGKLTSKECPYQKKHFTLTVNKKSGTITDIKDNGTYIELYNKKCTNNPRLLKIEKKEEPKDEPKKPTKRR